MILAFYEWKDDATNVDLETAPLKELVNATFLTESLQCVHVTGFESISFVKKFFPRLSVLPDLTEIPSGFVMKWDGVTVILYGSDAKTVVSFLIQNYFIPKVEMNLKNMQVTKA
jgi:hypothetical protein